MTHRLPTSYKIKGNLNLRAKILLTVTCDREGYVKVDWD